MDAAFCVISGGKQYNVHASKVLHMERLDTRVGPIEIEVIEPFQRFSLLDLRTQLRSEFSL